MLLTSRFLTPGKYLPPSALVTATLVLRQRFLQRLLAEVHAKWWVHRTKMAGITPLTNPLFLAGQSGQQRSAPVRSVSRRPPGMAQRFMWQVVPQVLVARAVKGVYEH